MNTIGPNQFPTAAPGGLQGIPGSAARVAAPAPQAPQAPADQVSLNLQAPGVPTPETVQTPSGVNAQVLRNQYALAFQAVLPAGHLIPAPIYLEGSTNFKGGNVEARLATNPEVALPAAVGTDGRVYVQMEPGSPLVSFDPGNLDYGLSSPLTVDASGVQHRDLQEVVHADGSRTVVHDEQIKPGAQGTQERTFTRIDISQSGQVAAARVTAQEGGPEKPQMGAKDVGMAVLTGGMSLLMGGSNKPQETALTAQAQPDGSISLGGGSFMDHAKNSATGGLRFNSPLLNWWKGRNAEAVKVVPFSAVLAANPGAVFPSLMAAARG